MQQTQQKLKFEIINCGRVAVSVDKWLAFNKVAIIALSHCSNKFLNVSHHVGMKSKVFIEDKNDIAR